MQMTTNYGEDIFLTMKWEKIKISQNINCQKDVNWWEHLDAACGRVIWYNSFGKQFGTIL